jgi:hypothetical protein
MAVDTMNAHEVLGLLPTATATAVKRAYRKLAQKYHPDKNKETGAEKRFILIKEAYEFLLTGKSNSGMFDVKPKTVPKSKPTPKPTPKPAPFSPVHPFPPQPPPVWQTGYGATNVKKIQLLVSFGEAFTGAHLRVPDTPFTIFVRPGIQNGQSERRLCRSAAGFEAYLDLEYRLYDPVGFYKIQELDRQMRVCCHIETTSGQVLSGFEHALKNINPNGGPVLVTIPVDHSKYIIIPNQGIRLDEAGHRSHLFVIPVIKLIPIEKEIQPVLVALNKKVQDALKAYRYFN